MERGVTPTVGAARFELTTSAPQLNSAAAWKTELARCYLALCVIATHSMSSNVIRFRYKLVRQSWCQTGGWQLSVTACNANWRSLPFADATEYFRNANAAHISDVVTVRYSVGATDDQGDQRKSKCRATDHARPEDRSGIAVLF